jgi:ATP-dependent DNA ligase
MNTTGPSHHGVGVAIFDALHRRGTVTEAMLYAFDLLELDGDDLRGMHSFVRLA